MPYYYVNNRALERDERMIHRMDCDLLPPVGERLFLDFHDTCDEAVVAAKRYYPFGKVDGCAVCSPDCHAG